MTTYQIGTIIDYTYTILLIWVLKGYFFALLEIVDRLANEKPIRTKSGYKENKPKRNNVTSINKGN